MAATYKFQPFVLGCRRFRRHPSKMSDSGPPRWLFGCRRFLRHPSNMPAIPERLFATDSPSKAENCFGPRSETVILEYYVFSALAYQHRHTCVLGTTHSTLNKHIQHKHHTNITYIYIYVNIVHITHTYTRTHLYMMHAVCFLQLFATFRTSMPSFGASKLQRRPPGRVGERPRSSTGGRVREQQRRGRWLTEAPTRRREESCLTG